MSSTSISELYATTRSNVAAGNGSAEASART